MSAALYLCLHLRDFAAQAMEFREPELRRRPLHPSKPNTGLLGTPLAVLSGTPPLEYVFAVNQQARKLGVECGMGRMQAESFAGVVIRPRERASEERAFATVVESANRFSPRIEIIAAPEEHSSIPARQRGPQRVCGWLAGAEQQARWEPCSEATLVLDIANSSRLFGTAEQIARAIDRAVRADGLEASIAVSRNAYAAILAARGNTGITIIPSGQEAQTLAPLPIAVFYSSNPTTDLPGTPIQPDEEQAETLAAWGIRTLGELAALPSRSLAARLGQSGLRLQTQARGGYDHLLVPTEEPADAPLSAELELEHPVELLEPLLFLLNQLLQQVLEAAQQRALAIASLEFTLFFEPTADGAPFLPTFGRSGKEDRRSIRPALPERDRLVLLKLIQLELELRPPSAAVIALRVVAHPARPQTAQQGLFAAQAPEPGRMVVLLARLRKLVGEGRAGSPELLDSRAPEAFRMAGFAPDAVEDHFADVGSKSDSPALRMLRPPREVLIELCRGAPVAMQCEGQRRRVQASSGPWRTSGEWWTHPGWCREEWEVVLDRDATQKEKSQNARLQNATLPNETLHGDTLRLAHDRANGSWYLIGIYD